MSEFGDGDRLYHLYCHLPSDHSDEEKRAILDFIIDDVVGNFKKNPLNEVEKATLEAFKEWRGDV